jgi:hypothetical protein
VGSVARLRCLSLNFTVSTSAGLFLTIVVIGLLGLGSRCVSSVSFQVTGRLGHVVTA